MANTEEIRKSMISSDTEEVAKILETLDESSKVLAKTYLSALVDWQRIENAKIAAAYENKMKDEAYKECRECSR